MTTQDPRPSLPADGDPRKAEPSTLWAVYTSAPKPSVKVPLPVSDKFKAKDALDEVAIVPISTEERMLCQIEAHDYALKYLQQLKLPAPKKDEDNRAYDSVYDMECTIRVLWRACKDAGDPKLERPAFPAPNAVRTLTPDQVSILSLHYVRVERLLSPMPDLATPEEMDAFVERLRLGGEKFPLDYLPSDGLRDLVWHLASRRATSPSPSNSPGSPPESTPPASDVLAEEPPAPTVEPEIATAPKAPPDKAPGLVRGLPHEKDPLVESHLKKHGIHPKKP